MKLRHDELVMEATTRKGKKVIPLLRSNGQVRYVDYADYLIWNDAYLVTLAQERARLDSIEQYAPKIRVMIGKTPRYFDTRAQAITALNTYNARHGLPACSVS